MSQSSKTDDVRIPEYFNGRDWQLLQGPGSQHFWNIFQLKEGYKSQVNFLQGGYLEITVRQIHFQASVCDDTLQSSEGLGPLLPEAKHQKGKVCSLLASIKLVAQEPQEAHISLDSSQSFLCSRWKDLTPPPAASSFILYS